MSSPFVAEIRMFGFNFSPTGWAECNGQLLPISQNTALFSLLGTFYGGDGKSTFALPDFQNSVAVGQGQGGGLQDWFLGQVQGSENVTLIQTEMPVHSHGFQATGEEANTPIPSATAPLGSGHYDTGTNNGIIAYYQTATSNVVNMNFQSLSVSGSSFPHNNMMPFLTLNYCIAMQGVFPPRP